MFYFQNKGITHFRVLMNRDRNFRLFKLWLAVKKRCFSRASELLNQLSLFL